MFQFKWLWRFFGPQLVHPLFGIDLGGSESNSEFEEETETTVEKESTQQSDTTTSSVATGDQETSSKESSASETSTEQILTSLDEETQDLLSGLLTDLAEGGSSAELITALNERALNAEDTLGALVDPIVTNARANLETELGQTQQELARAAGSSQNTLVAQFGLEESAKIEREIADLSASLGFAVEDAVTQQQTAAIGASEDLIIQLADVLKGATETSAATETTEAVAALEEIIASLQTEDSEQSTTVTEESLLEALEEVEGEGSSGDVSAGFSFGL